MDRYLTLLRNKIRERGFTQLEVQEALSWGRSYISQLLTKQKSLRVEQVLLILNVIGVEPAEFFAELHGTFRPSTAWSERPVGVPMEQGQGVSLGQEVAKFKAALEAVVGLLIDKRMVTSSDLRAAVEEAEAGGE